MITRLAIILDRDTEVRATNSHKTSRGGNKHLSATCVIRKNIYPF